MLPRPELGPEVEEVHRLHPDQDRVPGRDQVLDPGRRDQAQED